MEDARVETANVGWRVFILGHAMHTLPNSEEERHHSPKVTLGRVGSEFWKKTRVSNSDFTQDQ